MIDQVEYEVDYRFARQRIRLCYSPDMKDIFIVEPDGGTAILNDLKILFNFEMDSRDRVVMLLAELPQLNNTLRLGIHEPLKQRIVMNYNLDGFSKEEGGYTFRISSRGPEARCIQTVFEDNAIEAILNAANGTPRMINKLCNVKPAGWEQLKSEYRYSRRCHASHQ